MIGFIGKGPIAMKLKFVEDMVGLRGFVVRFEVVMRVHGMLRRLDRDRRGLHGDEAHGPDGSAPGAQRRARWLRPAILSRDGKARRAAGK
ncbi:hypothetical protein Sj15T_31560 [Sphingobium sp. TA15]|nr:hypothetical protein Sj15T_31560 [Sphingobium sp. TA15]